MTAHNSGQLGDGNPGDTGATRDREKSLGVVEKALAATTALLALI
jgi:hypothetical protein